MNDKVSRRDNEIQDRRIDRLSDKIRCLEVYLDIHYAGTPSSFDYPKYIKQEGYVAE